MALTEKQERFCLEYIIDLNATQAAIRAGYSEDSAGQQGHMLLKNPEIQGRIRDHMDARAARTRITADRVLLELGRIGFADIRRAVQWQANVTGIVTDDETGEDRMATTNQVSLIDSDKIDDDTAYGIAEISQLSTGGLKVKMHDKLGALDRIGKHLGMFIDRQAAVNPDGSAAQPGTLLMFAGVVPAADPETTKETDDGQEA